MGKKYYVLIQKKDIYNEYKIYCVKVQQGNIYIKDNQLTCKNTDP